LTRAGAAVTSVTSVTSSAVTSLAAQQPAANVNISNAAQLQQLLSKAQVSSAPFIVIHDELMR